MNVVDSSAWLEYLAKSENGARFAPVIQNSPDLIVPTITIYEVFRQVAVQRDEEEALKAIGLMATGQVVDLPQQIAMLGAIISIEHVLPMADSLILATARTYAATLWTQDEHFKGLADVEYVKK